MSAPGSAGGADGGPASGMVELVELVLQRTPGVEPEDGGWKIVYRDAHSNDVAEVRMSGGRVLHVKRARGPDGLERCTTSRLASRLLRERAGLEAPVHLDFEPPLDAPVMAYWRLHEPTLHGVMAGWPEGHADLETFTSLGRLIARVQRIRFEGHGPLTAPSRSLAEHLELDVGGRLKPAVYGEWLEGTESLEGLLHVVRRWVRGHACPAVLAHNDLHAENVLCRERDGIYLCIGVLDLEDAFVGAPESDLAKLEVLHGPLFGQPWRAAWLDAVLRGYAHPLDPFRQGVLRIYHLLNLGFYAAHIGLEGHARRVARAAELELDALGRAQPHAEVVGVLA